MADPKGPADFPELYDYDEGMPPLHVQQAIEGFLRGEAPAAPQPGWLESGAVEPTYPLEGVILGGGGAGVARSLLSQAARRVLDAQLQQEPLMVGPPMQVVQASGRGSPIPRNARLRQIDRALGEFGRYGRLPANRPYRPAGKDKPAPLTPQEVAEIWNRINPKWPGPVPRPSAPPPAPASALPAASRTSPTAGQRPFWDWGM